MPPGFSYLFSGHERLQLFFATPNLCGAFLAMLYVGCAGVFGIVYSRLSRIQILVVGSFLLLGMALGVAATYSRGALLAATVGLVILLVVAKPSRRMTGIAMVVLFLACLIVPSGARRLEQVIPKESDASVANRTILWRHTAVMIFDYPLGVGKANFNSEYSGWYQPTSMSHQYRTAVSDPLTVAANYGLPALFGYLTLTWGIGAAGLIGPKTERGWLVVLSAVQITYIVAGCFSTLLYCAPLYLTYSAIILVSLLVVAKRYTGYVRRFLFVGTSLAILYIGIVGIVAAATRSDVRSRKRIVALERNGAWTFTTAEPRDGKADATLIYIPPSPPTIEDVRNVLRPVSELHIRVVLVSLSDYGFKGQADFAEILASAVRTFGPVVIAGEGDGGRVAINGAARFRSKGLLGVVAINAPYTYPFEALSPANQLRTVAVPVLLLGGRANWLYDVTATRSIWRTARAEGLATELVELDATNTRDALYSGSYTDYIATFCRRIQPPQPASGKNTS